MGDCQGKWCSFVGVFRDFLKLHSKGPYVNRMAIGSRRQDFARRPSHTTVRAVFRIRRLNAAVMF
jgi:hypothetical protein